MNVLIDARSLAARLGTPGNGAPDGGAFAGVVVDARWRLAGPSSYPDYLAGHLPDAVWADLDTDFADPPGPHGRHPLPEPGRLQRNLRAFGIGEGDPVVVYDDGDGAAAARAWWVLRWAGLTDVRVLDGGIAAWRAAGGSLEQGAPRVTPQGAVTVRHGAMPTLDAQGAARLASSGVLLDARAAERYRGDTEPVDPVAGHVPGARSAPSSGNVSPDGRFLSPDRLRRRFEQLGVHAGDPVGAYCGSGVTAAHTVLALELAGFRAALYPGSWSEWITDPSRPVATGDGTRSPDVSG